MMILGIDTCLAACSAALVEDGALRAGRSEPMARGHQERLAPLVAELLAEAGTTPAGIGLVGVTVGPGSFTGLRVGVAFAKGFAAALGVPVRGVGVLEALAAPVDGLAFAVLDANRGQVYLQAFEGGRALMAADVLPVETAAARLAELAHGRPAVLVGSGGPLLAEVLPSARLVEAHACDPAVVAKLAGRPGAPPARPLYLRAPDARLPGGRLPPAA